MPLKNVLSIYDNKCNVNAMEKREIYVRSSLDATMQPSVFFKSDSKEKRPLLVGLHTWSFDRFNQVENMLPFAEKYDFNLLLPEFRGANLETNKNCMLACGSEYAKQDIVDAIDYAIAYEGIDSNNIFLLGLSGGGHMALLMAAKCPLMFKAIGAYVPITNLEKWAQQNEQYANHIQACCGNSSEEMQKRSPVNYIHEIARANLKIFHGKSDSVVPVAQSIDFFSSMMKLHPEARVYLDVFDGGHEIDMEQAMYWLLSQYDRKNAVDVTG